MSKIENSINIYPCFWRRLTCRTLVCSTSIVALLIRSVGGLSQYFYQDLWLYNLNAGVIGQIINRRGVALEFPHHVTVSSSFSAQFLCGFPYRFQGAWTVVGSMIHPLNVVQVGAWNSLVGLKISKTHNIFNVTSSWYDIVTSRRWCLTQWFDHDEQLAMPTAELKLLTT